MDGIEYVHTNMFYAGQVWKVGLGLMKRIRLMGLCDLLLSAVLYAGFVHEFFEAFFFQEVFFESAICLSNK